ncbi:hypothetical protein [Methanobrevibacter sp.]|uniref:hypothetical protein n=1 Tax=Methanobrevibacter sp. TaxID=66852 RepID=UPI003869CD5F
MESFEFESGRVLENVEVAYFTSGVPKYDDEGNIINAIIYSPTLQGQYSFFTQYKDLVNIDQINKDDYFFIRIFSLGNPRSCSPSTTDLRYNFPNYTFKDRINFKKQFLAEKFGNIKKLFGIIGEGVGGYETLTWACEYPDDMEFIIVLNGSYKVSGYSYVIAKCIDGIIDSSDDFYSDIYDASLSKAVVIISRLIFAGYFSKNVLENLSSDELDVFMEDYIDDTLSMDIYDFKFRNDCILKYNLEDKISNVKAKALIIGMEGYLFNNVETQVIPLGDFIEDSKLVIFHPKRQSYYEDEDYSMIISELQSFLNRVKK